MDDEIACNRSANAIVTRKRELVYPTAPLRRPKGNVSLKIVLERFPGEGLQHAAATRPHTDIVGRQLDAAWLTTRYNQSAT